MVSKTKSLQVKQSSQLAVAQAIEGAISSAHDELIEFENIKTEDQQIHQEKVENHFHRIALVLQNIGTENTLTGPEWEPVREWCEMYIALFLAIDASLEEIRHLIRGRYSQQEKLSASYLIGEIIKGHYLFFLSPSYEGNFEFSVKAIREGLRKVKKLETMDKLDIAAYDNVCLQISNHAEKRIGDNLSFFAVHLVCLLGCKRAATQKKSAQRCLHGYESVMNQKMKTLLGGLREGSGAKGFAYRGGDLLLAQKGGSYAKAKAEEVTA